MVKVVVFGNRYASHEVEAELLKPLGAELDFVSEAALPALGSKFLSDVKVLLVRDARVDSNVLALCPSLKGIVRFGVGYDGIDLQAASSRQIFVANIPDYGADIEVADHALALFLAVARRIASRDADIRRNIWGVGQDEPIYRIAGSVLGLIGYGRVARAVHKRFTGFGISEVIAYDPPLESQQPGITGVTFVDLDELAQRADIISIHAPGGDAPIVSRSFLAKVKPTTILVNTSRGSNVDETALADALREKRIRGAGLDVFATEPPSATNPLLASSDVVLSDHAGWYSESTVGLLQRQAAEEAVRILLGQPPHSWVNRW